MSMLFADSSGSGSDRGTEPRWRQVSRHPLVVLVLGLLAMAVVLLALFGPFYLFDFPPGQLLVWAILDGPGSLLPSRFQWWLGDHTFIALLVVSGLVLVVVPWYIADVRQRAQRRPKSAGSTSASTSRSGFSISAGITRERRETSVEFTEDGRVERSSGSADGAARYSVADLRSMASASGIPWSTVYETEGGARAFLELLRAVHVGPTPTPTSSSSSTSTSGPTPTSTPATAPTPGSRTEDPVASSGDPSEGSAPWRETASTGAGDASAAAGADGFSTSTSSSSAPFSSSTTSTTSWTSGFTSSASVYTPASLYDAERAERAVLGTDPQHDAEGSENGVENR